MNVSSVMKERLLELIPTAVDDVLKGYSSILKNPNCHYSLFE